jgi:uncharacterized repeat protein (TIGR01451 family)
MTRRRKTVRHSPFGGLSTAVLMLAMSALWTVAGAPPASAALPAECTQSGTTVTCTYTSGDNVFVVPTGVSSLHVVAIGGRGSDSANGEFYDSVGGYGARVTGDLPVTPGDPMHAIVGGNAFGRNGGANGGGGGGPNECSGGGGGASDIRSGADLPSRLLVAAGGGGGGCPYFFPAPSGGQAGEGGYGDPADGISGGGGQAGCATATATICGAGGAGGSNNAGAGTAGASGSAGLGGAGGTSSVGRSGGGGGGGLFGGGGGGGGGAASSPPDFYIGSGGGGGGGSSLVPAGGSISIDTTMTPMIEISYSTDQAPNITFTSDAPPAGTVGTPYSFTYAATGDTGIAFGNATGLPPGLSLAQDGTLSGTPTTAGDYTFTVTATGSSGAAAQRTDTVQISPPPASPPAASPSPSSVDFGSQALGTTSAARTVTLTNTGGSPLTISGLSITGSDFAFGADCGVAAGESVLDPGESCVVTVTFAPTATGARSGSLTFIDNAADSPQTVPLSGSGTSPPAPVASVSPSSIDFGNQLVGTTSSPRTVTLTNTGGSPLTISGLFITGSDFAFGADCGVAAGVVLDPGQSCAVPVTFAPTATGARSGSLTFIDNAADSPHTVALSGTGVPPTADLAVSISASPNPAKKGSKISYTITVLNAGPMAATNVLLNDYLSSQSTFVSASIKKGEGSCVTPAPGASGTVSCNLGSIASGATNVTQIVVTVIAKKTTITNTATVSCSISDPNTANNTASITTQIK